MKGFLTTTASTTVILVAALGLSACEQKSFDLAVAIPTIGHRNPLLPEYAARRGRPYEKLTDTASEVARRAVNDIIGESPEYWIEGQGIEAIWVSKQKYCYRTGNTGFFQVDRIKPEVARARFVGCKAGEPEALGVDGGERFALVRLQCSPRSNGWHMVRKKFEVRALVAIEDNVALGAISFDVGDPARLNLPPEKFERKNCY